MIEVNASLLAIGLFCLVVTQELSLLRFPRAVVRSHSQFLHVNGLFNKFCEDDESVIASAKECRTPMFADKPCIAMPVFSSGQTAMQPPETYRRLGSADLIYTAGGGIMGHPDGPSAGVASLRQAWAAALAGIDAHEYARTHPALAAALKAYAG